MASSSAVHGEGSALDFGLEALTPSWKSWEVPTGTTIMAVQYDGGMVLEQTPEQPLDPTSPVE